MKFQTSPEHILPAVALASRFVGRQANLPALAAVFMSAESDLVMVRATNLECGVEVSFPAVVANPGAAAVSGAVLAGFLQNTRGKSVSVEQVGEVLRVETDRSKASLKTLSVDDVPTLPRVTDNESFRLPAADLARLLRSVGGCASVSGVKPELQGIFLTGEAGKITAAATDSFRLAEKTVSLKSKGGVPSMLLPARNAAELVRILEGHTGDVEVHYSKNQLSVQVGAIYYTSRLIDGAFPNYRQVIPTEFAAEAVVLKDDFSQALKSLQLFTDKFLQVSFLCDPKKGAIELSSQNPDVGEELITLKTSATGSEVKLNFNSRYLADATGPIMGESLRLRMQGPGKPLLVRDAADESYVYLAMPMNR